LVDFVEDGLTTHFFTPMLQDLSQRKKLGVTRAVSHFCSYVAMIMCHTNILLKMYKIAKYNIHMKEKPEKRFEVLAHNSLLIIHEVKKL